MSEAKTGYFVDGGNGGLYRRLHCVTSGDDFIEVGTAFDEEQRFAFNIEMHYTSGDESGENPSVNLTPETAKLLIQDLEAYIRDCEEDVE
ncbi:hypothetical protein PPISBEST_193 [Bacillus phage PPIsBest]|uniref:Uncharacterized protein n=1 Tax=Bacillus phage PPIsBest TaxID=2024234 RepID=A0A222Z142_9CAUD|nr:hypothetical protein PPISBEST_193 [Bacillus phage PPIsBest]QDH49467.1 hypothetical protein PHIREBALL_193 [Bacillus phage Phireball]ULF49102.1 hypothetical protein [Bacillus phage Darren]